MSNCVRSLVLP
uniref:Uncharacterized protein n=1 Tax=Arundo donax TaxID=35708 RepID=A0A0A9APE7_ARUDO